LRLIEAIARLVGLYRKATVQSRLTTHIAVRLIGDNSITKNGKQRLQWAKAHLNQTADDGKS